MLGNNEGQREKVWYFLLTENESGCKSTLRRLLLWMYSFDPVLQHIWFKSATVIPVRHYNKWKWQTVQQMVWKQNLFT